MAFIWEVETREFCHSLRREERKVFRERVFYWAIVFVIGFETVRVFICNREREREMEMS